MLESVSRFLRGHYLIKAQNSAEKNVAFHRAVDDCTYVNSKNFNAEAKNRVYVRQLSFSDYSECK